MKRALVLPLLLALALPALAEDAAPPPRDVEAILKDLRADDADVRLAAAKEARERQEEKISSALVRLLKDREEAIRVAAVEALGARTERAAKRLAAEALSSRLPSLDGKVDHEAEYAATIQALHDLAEPVSIKALLDITLEEPKETARARLMAVGNVPDAAALEGLIDFASKGRARRSNQQHAFAIEALRYATGQNLGNDPDRWRDWWHDVKADWDFQRAADRRAEERAKEEAKREKQEESRRKAEERRRKREEKPADGGGSGD